MQEFNQHEVKQLCLQHRMALKDYYKFREGGEILVFLKVDELDGVNRLLFIESHPDHTQFAMRSVLQWHEHLAEDSGAIFYSTLACAVEEGIRLFPALLGRFNSIHRKVESLLAVDSQ